MELHWAEFLFTLLNLAIMLGFFAGVIWVVRRLRSIDRGVQEINQKLKVEDKD